MPRVPVMRLMRVVRLMVRRLMLLLTVMPEMLSRLTVMRRLVMPLRPAGMLVLRQA